MTIEDNYTPRSISIDKNNNIYLIDIDSHIYKCLANEMEFKQMTGLLRSITNVKFDDKNNIYVLAKKNYPYKYLANEMNFKEICNKQTFNDENQFEVTYRFAAHDWIIIKISYDIFLNMEQIYNDENQSNFKKLFYNIIIGFAKKDETGLAGGILELDYTTAISIIIEHFEEINQFFKTLSQGQGIKITTNRIGSWDKNDNMGVFNQ